jgi:hypothetical protein
MNFGMCQLERLVANTAALAALSAGREICSRKWPNGEKGRNKGGQTKVPKGNLFSETSASRRSNRTNGKS